jgi:hypothetical protein
MRRRTLPMEGKIARRRVERYAGLSSQAKGTAKSQ